MRHQYLTKEKKKEINFLRNFLIMKNNHNKNKKDHNK